MQTKHVRIRFGAWNKNLEKSILEKVHWKKKREEDPQIPFKLNGVRSLIKGKLFLFRSFRGPDRFYLAVVDAVEAVVEVQRALFPSFQRNLAEFNDRKYPGLGDGFGRPPYGQCLNPITLYGCSSAKTRNNEL
ncbi:hypothetical protein GWI33_020231 [Rhynchophorus ferrugineus]|uniref:Uncharacterized protein n=1 Tax=Rhynchophorus ferrugineus TaxID=354439 RepID=A0A834M650_RHYFE|nr:hypothetical protein GWI33_020231 [Rhynchophorus ferrugineus]